MTPGLRRVAVMALAVGVLALVALLVIRVLPGDGSGGADDVERRPARLSALAVDLKGARYMSVIASGGDADPIAFAVPSRLALLLPGSGTVVAGEPGVVSGDQLATALSNAMGAWVSHQGRLGAQALRTWVDSAGSVEVEGAGSMTGQETVSYLAQAPAAERDVRWELTLGALLDLEEGPAFSASDDAGAMEQALDAAAGSTVEPLPTLPSAGGLERLDLDAIRTTLQADLGIDVPPAVEVIALNGSGVPGIGASVARRLVPGGFRIVSSRNAADFDHDHTLLYATTPRAMREAERARQLLGVGTVVLGGGASGLADITIVVGKDFKDT